MTEQIKKFIDEIRSINEVDYGDFMRVANCILIDLREECHRRSIQDLDKKIFQIQNYLQFSPSWQVETTRQRILKDSFHLDELLVAHQQDWESYIL